MSYKSYSKLGVDPNAPAPESMIQIPEVTTVQERENTLRKNRLVVIDNYADWCGPCKYVAPKFAQLAKKYTRHGLCAFIKENVDSRIQGAPPITGIPCFHFYVDGKYIKDLTVTGGDIQQVESNITSVLDKLGQ